MREAEEEAKVKYNYNLGGRGSVREGLVCVRYVLIFNIYNSLRRSGRHALCRKVREAEEEPEVDSLPRVSGAVEGKAGRERSAGGVESSGEEHIVGDHKGHLYTKNEYHRG